MRLPRGLQAELQPHVCFKQVAYLSASEGCTSLRQCQDDSDNVCSVIKFLTVSLIELLTRLLITLCTMLCTGGGCFLDMLNA